MLPMCLLVSKLPELHMVLPCCRPDGPQACRLDGEARFALLPLSALHLHAGLWTQQ